jgi:hypothetical protein
MSWGGSTNVPEDPEADIHATIAVPAKPDACSARQFPPIQVGSRPASFERRREKTGLSLSGLDIFCLQQASTPCAGWAN